MTERTNTTQFFCTRLMFAILMTGLGVLAYSECEARTYRVSAVRTKVAQGNWDLGADGKVSILRQESGGAQWALEQRVVVGGLEETKILDSSNAVIWEGKVGEMPLLSYSAPAFAVASRLNFERQVYNLTVGPEPVYRVESGLSAEPFQSRDGTAFGITLGRRDIQIVSLQGELLGNARIAPSMRLAAIALSNGGEYAAVAERKYNRTAPGGGVWEQQVSLFNRQGELIGRIDKDSESGEPQCLALSSDDPPRMAIGTENGVSYWSPQGALIWRDTTAFDIPVRDKSVQTMYVTDDGRVLRLVTATSAGAATLWVWSPKGTREAQLELPEEFDVSGQHTGFLGATDSSITIQSQGEVLTVVWSDE